MTPPDDLDGYFDDVSNAGNTKDGARRRKRDREVTKRPGQPTEAFRSVGVSKIIDLQEDRKLDHEQVCRIAASAQLLGFIHPIAVRQITYKKGSKVRTGIALVSGAYRLQAARYLGHEYIDCKFVQRNDDEFAQLIQIGEDLFHKHITVLEHSELLTKWCELLRRNAISGQGAQKSRRGRPRGGDSEVARMLALNASVEAWRAMIRRAKNIASIRLQAKQAAIEAGLDDNQQALLAIANSTGRKAQLKFVNALAAKLKIKDDHTDRRKQPQDRTADKKGNSEDTLTGNESKDQRGTDQQQTTYEDLEEFWQTGGKKLWTYAPQTEREKFYAMLRKAKCKARADVADFVRSVFCGRDKVFAREVCEFAQKQGLSLNAVRKALSALDFQRKRAGKRGPWYYRNTNQNWRDQLRIIPSLKGEPAFNDDYYSV